MGGQLAWCSCPSEACERGWLVLQGHSSVGLSGYGGTVQRRSSGTAVVLCHQGTGSCLAIPPPGAAVAEVLPHARHRRAAARAAGHKDWGLGGGGGRTPPPCLWTCSPLGQVAVAPALFVRPRSSNRVGRSSSGSSGGSGNSSSGLPATTASGPGMQLAAAAPQPATATPRPSPVPLSGPAGVDYVRGAAG